MILIHDTWAQAYTQGIATQCRWNTLPPDSDAMISVVFTSKIQNAKD